MPLLRIFRLVQEVSREDGLSARRSPSRTSGEPWGKLFGYRVSGQVSVSLNGRDYAGAYVLKERPPVRPLEQAAFMRSQLPYRSDYSTLMDKSEIFPG
jgi:hypothetical protein